jgi:hypothetical protein
MKGLFLLLGLSLTLFSCKTAKTYELSDGTFITERKANRMAMRTVRQEFKKLSKQEQEDVMMMTVDTTQY